MYIEIYLYEYHIFYNLDLSYTYILEFSRVHIFYNLDIRYILLILYILNVSHRHALSILEYLKVSF